MGRYENYEVLGLTPDCTDEELRRAYLKMIRECHPDLNPNRIEWATTMTQTLTATYQELKYQRGAMRPDSSSQAFSETLKIRFNFFDGFDLDLEAISRRKGDFRRAWEEYSRNPSDPLKVLRLVFVAIRAERQESIRDLLCHGVIVDCASLLLSIEDRESASNVLVRWSNILTEQKRLDYALQILEDAVASGLASAAVSDALRRVHTTLALGPTSSGDQMPPPEVRIHHLNRILELGCELGYVHKFLAKAWHDLGNDDEARDHLREAFRIDPELFGAVRISRALGFTDKPSGRPQLRKSNPVLSMISVHEKGKLFRPEETPSASTIREWQRSCRWENILTYSEIHRYKSQPAARNTIRQIARSLGYLPDDRARQALMGIIQPTNYWDVIRAAIISLAKIGDEKSLEFLGKYTPRSDGDAEVHAQGLEYLKARLANPSNPSAIVGRLSSSELLKQGNQTLAKLEYGKARFLLENALSAIGKQDHHNFAVLISLARACSRMGDCEESVALILPVLADLAKEDRDQVSQELAGWLWSKLLGESYHSDNDKEYLAALNINLEFILTSTDPAKVLGSARWLTRWLDLLGDNDTAHLLRRVIREETPGTGYADKHDSIKSQTQTLWSQGLSDSMEQLVSLIRSVVPARLREVLRTPQALQESGKINRIKRPTPMPR